jgi:hypothetical protein
VEFEGASAPADSSVEGTGWVRGQQNSGDSSRVIHRRSQHSTARSVSESRCSGAKGYSEHSPQACCRTKAILARADWRRLAEVPSRPCSSFGLAPASIVNLHTHDEHPPSPPPPHARTLEVGVPYPWTVSTAPSDTASVLRAPAHLLFRPWPALCWSISPITVSRQASRSLSCNPTTTSYRVSVASISLSRHIQLPRAVPGARRCSARIHQTSINHRIPPSLLHCRGPFQRSSSLSASSESRKLALSNAPAHARQSLQTIEISC